MVKAAHDVRVALTRQPNESHPMVEIVIGAMGNTQTQICYNQTMPNVIEVYTPRILNKDQIIMFCVSATPEGVSWT